MKHRNLEGSKMLSYRWQGKSEQTRQAMWSPAAQTHHQHQHQHQLLHRNIHQHQHQQQSCRRDCHQHRLPLPSHPAQHRLPLPYKTRQSMAIETFSLTCEGTWRDARRRQYRARGLGTVPPGRDSGRGRGRRRGPRGRPTDPASAATAPSAWSRYFS